MSSRPVEPSIYSDHDVYMGYEIRTEVLGPVMSNPDDRIDLSIHYRASLAVFHHHKEVDGSREYMRLKFLTKEDAQQEAMKRGKDLVRKLF